MAFCPNCGTPNTDQADKCVTCGAELAIKQRAKFKGTIMMTGIQAPNPAPAPSHAEQQPPAPVPPESPASSGPLRNPNHARTMLGHAPVVAPPAAEPAVAPPPAGPMPLPPADGLRASGTSPSSTLRGPAAHTHDGPIPGEPRREPPVPQRGLGDTFQPARTSDAELPAFQRSASNTRDSASVPPQARRDAGPSKILLLGCVGALAVTCIVAGLLYYALAPKIKTLLSGGRDAEAQAAAWHAQLTQALTQVTELCKTDCQKADVFFHPVKQIALLPEAKALTPARVQRLGDASAKAEMLDATDDGAIASELALDPQQCVRVVQGGAKVVSCSVPEATGRTGVLRIVHLSGVGSL